MENKEIRRQNLLLLIDEFRSASALAEAIETDATYIRNIKNRVATKGKVRGMGDDLARRIEEKLGKEPGWMDRIHTAANSERAEYRVEARVPVVGTAQAGDDGYWEELQYPTGHGEGFVRYPTRDQNAYAIRVKGDSMRPRIKPGEFLLIEPNGAVVAGEEVLVTTTDGRSMVKVLGPRRDGTVELHSINEDHRPITLDETQIRTMHYVAAIVKSSRYYRDELQT